jgi:SLT domain-containing protein
LEEFNNVEAALAALGLTDERLGSSDRVRDFDLSQAARLARLH